MSLFRAYSRASKRLPYTIAFGTCFIKGSASDALAQVVIEKRTLPGLGKATEEAEEINIRRNFAFALFSGVYLGCFQHVLYNIIFTRLFGASQSLKVAAKKVGFDLFVTTPLMYLPIYYASEYAILKRDPWAGVNTYFIGKSDSPPEIVPVMKRYTVIWPAFHLFNFTVTPPELRIAAIACVSFLWLTILSNVSHQDMSIEDEPPQREASYEKVKAEHN